MAVHVVVIAVIVVVFIVVEAVVVIVNQRIFLLYVQVIHENPLIGLSLSILTLALSYFFSIPSSIHGEGSFARAE